MKDLHVSVSGFLRDCYCLLTSKSSTLTRKTPLRGRRDTPFRQGSWYHKEDLHTVNLRGAFLSTRLPAALRDGPPYFHCCREAEEST